MANATLIAGTPQLAAEVRRLRERERVLMEALNTDIEAMDMVIKHEAQSYHDCIDDGLSKCAWCFIKDAKKIARSALETVKDKQ